MMHFEIYQQQQGMLSAGLPHPDYRWRLRANNGEIIAESGEGYRNKVDCQHGIELVRATSAATLIVDHTPQHTGLLAAALYGLNPK